MPVTEYYWDELSDNLLMEADENGDPTAVYTNEPDVFGELVSQERDSVESFYHFDGQGSTRELTDASETVTDEYTYTAFGETVARSGLTENSFQYSGAYGYSIDPACREIYVRARRYAPLYGAWLSRDPWSFVDGLNVYAYSRNNPIKLNDASGLVSYDTLSRDFRGCSKFFSFKWVIEWKLAPKDRFGYIIQRVRDFFLIANCDCTKCEVSAKCPEFFAQGKVDPKTLACSVMPVMSEYWEIWPVKEGVVYTGKPPNLEEGSSDALLQGPLVGTMGYSAKYVEAYFYSTTTQSVPPHESRPPTPESTPDCPPPPGGWPIWTVQDGPPTGKLAYTCGSAAFDTSGRRPIAERSVRYLWRCCNDDYSFALHWEHESRV